MDIDTPLPKSGVGFVTNNQGSNGEFLVESTSRVNSPKLVVHYRQLTDDPF